MNHDRPDQEAGAHKGGMADLKKPRKSFKFGITLLNIGQHRCLCSTSSSMLCFPIVVMFLLHFCWILPWKTGFWTIGETESQNLCWDDGSAPPTAASEPLSVWLFTFMCLLTHKKNLLRLRKSSCVNSALRTCENKEKCRIFCLVHRAAPL